MAGNLVLGLGQLVLSLEHGPYGTSLQDQSSEAKPVFPTALSNRLWSAWLKTSATSLRPCGNSIQGIKHLAEHQKNKKILNVTKTICSNPRFEIFFEWQF